MLSVLGSNSHPLFLEGRQLLHGWFPGCQDADIAGATHLLPMQTPGPVAATIATFLSKGCMRTARLQAPGDACRSFQK